MKEVGKLEDFFDERSRRIVFLGHMLAAAPNLIIMSIGLLIAGLGWLSSKVKLKKATGSTLIASGSLLGLFTSCTWFASIENFNLNSLRHLSITLPLGTAFLVSSVVAYGFLMRVLIDLGARCNLTSLKYAALFFAYLIIALSLTTSILIYSFFQSSMPDPPLLQALSLVFEVSFFSILLANFLGNILVGVGLVKGGIKLINSRFEKKQVGGFDMKVKVKWLGHAAFMLTFKGKRILIDPWISNPLSPIKVEELERVDYIIVTHDHFDHLGDAESIAKRFNSTIIGVPELVLALEKEGVRGLGLNMGAFVNVDDVFKVALVPALHTCSAGEPVGVVLDFDGLRIYHMGDTGYTSEFQAIKEVFNPEVVLIPIGGHYTMGPREAAFALKVLTPKIAIPMHYATFPVLVKSPNEFVELAKILAPNVKVVVLKPGEEFEVP